MFEVVIKLLIAYCRNIRSIQEKLKKIIKKKKERKGMLKLIMERELQDLIFAYQKKQLFADMPHVTK